MAFGTDDELVFGDDDAPVSGESSRGRPVVAEQARKIIDHTKAVQAQRDAAQGVWQGQSNAAEAAMRGVGHMAGEVPAFMASAAQAAGNLLGVGPQRPAYQARDEMRSNVNDLLGTPSPGVQRAGDQFSGAIAPISKITEPVKNSYRSLVDSAYSVPYAGPTLGAGLEGGEMAIEALLGGAKPEAGPSSYATRDLAAAHGKATSRSAVADVAHRYTVVPDDASVSAGVVPGEVKGSTRASMGPNVTNTEVPFKNINEAQRRVVADMPQQGITDPNGRVDAGLLQGAIEREAVPYEQVKTLPTPPTNTLANRVHSAWQSRGASLKGDAVAEAKMGPLMDPNAPPLPTADLLSRWREINSYAADLRNQAGEGSAAARIKSGDLKAISESLLDEINSRAEAFGAHDLVPQLQQARVNIARLHTLDDALDDAGWIDPSKLAAMADRHVPLTGELAQLAADAKAAPRSLTPLGKAVNNNETGLDQFGRQPNSWVRNVLGHVGGNKLARGGVESLNTELRAGSGLLRREAPPVTVPPLQGPMGPPFPEGASSPVPPPAPTSVPPGMQPYDRLSDRLAPDFNPAVLEPATGAPKDAAISSFLADTSPDTIPWEAPGKVKPVSPAGQGSISSDLGPVSQNPGLNTNMPGAGIPDVPEGVTGPRSAQLSSPQLSDDLAVGDQPPPREPDFGPGDEFPGPQGPPPAPPESGVVSVTPTEHMVYHNGQVDGPYTTRDSADLVHAYLAEKYPGQAPVGVAEPAFMRGENVSDTLSPQDPISIFRGVADRGKDPYAPGSRGYSFWGDKPEVADSYRGEFMQGPRGELKLDPSQNKHIGDINAMYDYAGVSPDDVDFRDALAIAMQKAQQEGDFKALSYDLRPEMNGTPREYAVFGQPPENWFPPETAGGSNVSDIIGPSPAKPDIIGTPPAAAPEMGAVQSKFDELSQQIATDPRFKDLGSDAKYVTDAIAAGDMEEAQAGIRDLTMKMAGRQPSTYRSKPRTE